MTLRPFWRRASPAAFSFLLALVASLVPFRAQSAPVLLDRVVAKVGSRTILRSAVLARARPAILGLPPAARSDPARVGAVVRAALDAAIDEQLIDLDAARLSVFVFSSEADDAIDAIAARNGWSREALLAQVATQGRSESEYREEIRCALTEARWTDRKLRPRVTVPPGTSEAERPNVLVALLRAERAAELARLREELIVEEFA